jgi:chromosome segregation ATPase
VIAFIGVAWQLFRGEPKTKISQTEIDKIAAPYQAQINTLESQLSSLQKTGSQTRVTQQQNDTTICNPAELNGRKETLGTVLAFLRGQFWLATVELQRLRDNEIQMLRHQPGIDNFRKELAEVVSQYRKSLTRLNEILRARDPYQDGIDSTWEKPKNEWLEAIVDFANNYLVGPTEQDYNFIINSSAIKQSDKAIAELQKWAQGKIDTVVRKKSEYDNCK